MAQKKTSFDMFKNVLDSIWKSYWELKNKRRRKKWLDPVKGTGRSH
jgi:hypothetical protein